MIGRVANFVPSLDAASQTAKFGHVDIRERVIDMGSRTIAIANITTISLQTTSRGVLRLIMALIGLAFLMSYFASTKYGSPDNVSLLVGLAILIAILFVRDLSDLVIVTNDGGRTVFQSNDIEGLASIMKFLTDKINRGDHTSGQSFVVNQSKVENKFDKVVFGTDSSTSIGNIDVGSIVHGNNNMVATGSPGAKLGTTENIFKAENSPGAVVGTGNTVTGNSVKVDYSSVLPTIEEWKGFYEQREDSRQLAERLSELEALMRSGTPTAASKGRVRKLASEISNILQGYPPAVELFQAVLRLVGG